MRVDRQPMTRLPRRGAQWLAGLLAVMLSAGVTTPAMAYQLYTFPTGGRVVTLKWNRFPVQYFITTRGAGGVSASDLQGAVSRAFSTWQGVSSARVSAQFVALTGNNPFDDDGMSTLGFMSRPDLDRVLGATDFLFDTTTGEIVESDIFFNSAFPWSVASGGEAGRFDLESVALHEIGHFFGLGHSAIGETELLPGGGRRVIAAESVMFPIAFSPGNISERTLRADDVAGLSDLYPSDTFKGTSGAIDGRVTKNGQGVYGAHVVAFDMKTAKLVGGFTVDSSGNFTIGALDPGAYVIRVEPVDDADLDSFFDDPGSVDLDFAITFFDRYVIVPHGGTSGTIEIKVAAKSGTGSTARSSTSIDPGVQRPGPVSPGASAPGRPVTKDPATKDPPRPSPHRRQGEERREMTDEAVEAVDTGGGPSASPALDREGEPNPEGVAGSWSAAWPTPLTAPGEGPFGLNTQTVAPKRPAKKSKAPGRAGSFEMSASFVYLGSASLGSNTAALTPNQTGTGSRYTYFQASAEMQRSAGFEGRLAYNLTRRIAVEGGMTYSRPGVGLTVSNDAEGAPGLSVTGETMSQYFFDVAGVVAFRSAGARQGRWTPFVEGGIGYLRQLHESSTLVETGQVFHGGGGVKYRLTSSPTSVVTGLSLRIDARFYYLNKGFSFDSTSRAFPAFGAGLEIAF